MELFFMVVASFVVVCCLLYISFFAMIGGEEVREQITPYECGFDSKQAGRVPFSVRFVFFVLLFLLFDIEVVLFFHLPMGSFFGGLSAFSLSFFSFLVFYSFIYEEEEMVWE